MAPFPGMFNMTFMLAPEPEIPPNSAVTVRPSTAVQVRVSAWTIPAAKATMAMTPVSILCFFWLFISFQLVGFGEVGEQKLQ